MLSQIDVGIQSESWVRHSARAAIVGGVLLISAYVAPHVSVRDLMAMGAILLCLGAFYAYLRWPALGVLALIVSCLVIPFSIGTGSDSAVNAGMLCLALLILLWLVDMFRGAEARFRPSRTFVPLIALCGIATLSFLLGVKPEAPFAQTAPMRAQVGGLAIFWLAAAAFALVSHQIRDVRWVALMTWLFIGLAVVYIMARILGLGLITQVLFSVGSTGSLFWTWLVALAFAQAAFNRTLFKPVRLALLGGVAATLYVGFFQARDWNSGWVPPLVAIAVAVWTGAPRLGACMTIIATAIFTLGRSVVAQYFLTSKQSDIVTREAAWSTLMNVIKVNPVLGLGPANYYWYSQAFSILGYNVRFNSHQQYVDLVAQTGVMGLACFAWFIVEIGLLGLRMRNRVDSGFAYAFVCGALAGLAGTVFSGLLGDWFIPFVYNIGFAGFRSSLLGWVFLGALLALDRVTSSPVKPGGISLAASHCRPRRSGRECETPSRC